MFSAVCAWHGIGTDGLRLMRIAAAFVFATAFVTVAATGCRRQDEEERRANERAEHIAQETTITSGELGSAGGGAGEGKVDDELREQAASLAAFRREQLETKARVQKELDAIDASHGSQARRAALKKDLDAIDRSTQADWPGLRQRIDRDVSPAPRVVPRSERFAAEPPPEAP